MPTQEEINDAIAENLIGPKQVQGDEGTVTQHDLDDQIKAAKHLAANTAAAKNHRGLRFTKLIPQGPG